MNKKLKKDKEETVRTEDIQKTIIPCSIYAREITTTIEPETYAELKKMAEGTRVTVPMFISGICDLYIDEMRQHQEEKDKEKKSKIIIPN